MNRMLIALFAVCVPMLSVASPPITEPVDVNVTNPVLQVEVVAGDTSSNQFTVPPKQLSIAPAGAALAPDPSGTRYAITSVTVTNPTDQNVTLNIRAVAVAGADPDCRFVFNQEDTADGPEVAASAHSTTQLTFPQPFVTAPVTGTHVCLVASGTGFIGVKWSAVGYRILP